jgi:hypothetical protein
MNIRGLLRESFSRLLIWTGAAAAVRRLFWRDRVAVLLYHDPQPETLDAHLTYLRRICDIVPLAEFDKPGRGRPRAVITLDDGHAGNGALLPVFAKHGVRPTIFICSGVVAQPRAHWWMHPAAAHADIERLKRLPNRERLRELSALGYRDGEPGYGEADHGVADCGGTDRGGATADAVADAVVDAPAQVATGLSAQQVASVRRFPVAYALSSDSYPLRRSRVRGRDCRVEARYRAADRQ